MKKLTIFATLMIIASVTFSQINYAQWVQTDNYPLNAPFDSYFSSFSLKSNTATGVSDFSMDEIVINMFENSFTLETKERTINTSVVWNCNEYRCEAYTNDDLIIWKYIQKELVIVSLHYPAMWTIYYK